MKFSDTIKYMTFLEFSDLSEFLKFRSNSLACSLSDKLSVENQDLTENLNQNIRIIRLCPKDRALWLFLDKITKFSARIIESWRNFVYKKVLKFYEIPQIQTNREFFI